MAESEIAVLENRTVTDSFVRSLERGTSEVRHDEMLSRLAVDHLENARHAMCVTDAMVNSPGPRIEWVNEAYCDLFCCDEDDMIGRTPRETQGALTDRRVLDRIRDHLERGRPLEAQAINYRLDGSAFRLRWTIDPVLDSDGTVVQFLASMRDITLEDRLRRRLAALDRLMSGVRTAEPSTDARTSLLNASASSIEPFVAEIGSADIELFGSTQSVASIDVDPADAHTASVAIGTVGHIALTIHESAGDLFDLLAVEEMATSIAWFADRVAD